MKYAYIKREVKIPSNVNIKLDRMMAALAAAPKAAKKKTAP